jgi:putative toxin-antitoxin system antitoxin component (TIGR02293 family)
MATHRVAAVAAQPKKPRLASKGAPLVYAPKAGVDEFARRLSDASPYEIVEVERNGVHARLLKDLAVRLDVPTMHFVEMLGVPKATVEKKVAGDELIAGSGGQAAIGVARLIAKAQEIVENSTAEKAKGFDAARWLGEWLDVPQPALGGRKPSQLLDTPTGITLVAKVLGAIESGAYQ